METESYTKHREGIGSSFHRETSFNIDKIDLGFDYEIFYCGRHAFKYILDEIHLKHKVDKIWMPEYYCQNAMNDWIKNSYDNVCFYKTNPFNFEEELSLSEFASKNDVVLLNNYWGLCNSFQKEKDYPIIIEDHSHGWLSNRCLNSKADYCFASLRKSLPIPLGGIYWKPKKNVNVDSSFFIEDDSFYNAWNIANKAMTEKKQYKEHNKNAKKESYLEAVNYTELFLDQHYEIIKLRKEDKAYINSFVNYNVLEKKKDNLAYAYNLLTEVDYIKIIKRKAFTAFGLMLLFKDEKLCASLKKHLITNEIYPSFLWPDNKLDSQWKFSINIHADYRYSKTDMQYITQTINNWIKLNN